jgi:hypothetical protein
MPERRLAFGRAVGYILFVAIIRPQGEQSPRNKDEYIAAEAQSRVSRLLRKPCY